MSLLEDHDCVSVFRGTRAASLEFGLVLEAKGIPYQSIALEREWVLAVTPDLAESARQELAHYAEERLVKRDRAPSIVPFDGADTGAIGYVFALLIVAYCAGANLFNADWFAIGALDASRPVHHQWWRALTALSLHAGPEHLFGNLLFGIVAGALCSRLLGSGIAWLSILLAGAGANVVELLVAPIDHRAVGASTAVFAALGLLAGYASRQRLSLRERWLYRWAPLIAGASLLTLLGAGEGTEHVDVLGHLLGFLVGVAAGWTHAQFHMPRSRSVRLQIGAGALAVVLLAGAWVLALRFGRS
jgi:membrane associated rhomboid family serine protease